MASDKGHTNRLSVCSDGMTPAQFEADAARARNIDVATYRQQFVDTLNAATPESIKKVFATKAGQGAGYGAVKGADKATQDAADATAERLAKEFHQVATVFAPPNSPTPTPATPWANADQFKDLLNGRAPGLSSFAGTGDGYSKHKRPMIWYLYRKQLAGDADWQMQTSASWVDLPADRRYKKAKAEYEKEKKRYEEEKAQYAKDREQFLKDQAAYAKANKGAVLDGCGLNAPTPPGPPPTAPDLLFADPSQSYVVTRPGTDFDFKPGDLYELKASELDKQGNSIVKGSTYAQVLEGGPGNVNGKHPENNMLEISTGGWSGMGYSDVSPSRTPPGVDVGYTKVASSSGGWGGFGRNADSRLSPDQIQLAGALAKAGLLSRRDGTPIGVTDLRDSLRKNEITPTKIPEALQKTLNDAGRKEIKGLHDEVTPIPEGGIYEMMKGFASVGAGPDQLCVAYANPACVHSGGGSVEYGSATVFVGDFPLSRVGDMTTDQYALKTGSPDIFVYGEPSKGAPA